MMPRGNQIGWSNLITGALFSKNPVEPFRVRQSDVGSSSAQVLTRVIKRLDEQWRVFCGLVHQPCKIGLSPIFLRTDVVACSCCAGEIAFEILKELFSIALRHNFADQIRKASDHPIRNGTWGIEAPRTIKVKHLPCPKERKGAVRVIWQVGEASDAIFPRTDPAFEPSLRQHRSPPSGNVILPARDEAAETPAEN